MVAVLLVGAARADDDTEALVTRPPPVAGQRMVGLGPTLGLQVGTGALIALGSPAGVLLSGGYMPILTTANQHETAAAEFRIYSSAQLNADVAITPWHPSPRSALGVVFGYKFNTLLGHGGGAGVSWAYDLGRKCAFFGLIGASVFPRAEHELIADHGYPTDRDLVLPWLQGGFNAGLMVYP
jgi:hypothetical protein